MSEVDPVGLEGPTKPEVLAVSSSDLVRRHAVQSEQGARAVLSDLFEMSAIIGRVISDVAASRSVIPVAVVAPRQMGRSALPVLMCMGSARTCLSCPGS